MAACQPEPSGAASPQPLSALAVAPPTHLPMEVVPSPQEVTNAAPPLLLPSPAGTPRPLPTPTAAPSASLPTEEVPTPREASTIAPPPFPPPLTGTPQPLPPPPAPSFAAQPAIGSRPSERPTRLSSRPSRARRPPVSGGPLLLVAPLPLRQYLTVQAINNDLGHLTPLPSP